MYNCLEEKYMSSELRKVVHIEVFDFDSDIFAYAKDSRKNQFGYKYKVEYQKNGKVIKEEPEVNNVERGAYYYNTFGVNLSQLRSLRRKVRELSKNKMIPFPEEDGINAIFRGGSDIYYRGEHTQDFCDKVLRLAR